MGSTAAKSANMHQALDYDDESRQPIGLTAIQRYAMLLSNGFITLDLDTEHTGNREKYDDPNGRFGRATTPEGVTTSYYFDNAEAAWYDADTDGNRLIGY